MKIKRVKEKDERRMMKDKKIKKGWKGKGRLKRNGILKERN